MDDVIRKAQDYSKYSQKISNAHYAMAENAKGYNKRLGIPATIVTLIVGTSIFATISSEKFVWLQIATGLLSVGAAVLSGLQTFFKYSEVEAQHKEAAARYESVWHKLDHFILKYSSGDEPRSVAVDALLKIAQELDGISKASPTIPDNVYDSVSPVISHDSRVDKFEP